MTTPNDAKLDRTAQNTDRELWREPPGDYYANSLHVTAQGGIGINVGGTVRVLTLAKWHALADANERLEAQLARVEKELSAQTYRLIEEQDVHKHTLAERENQAHEQRDKVAGLLAWADEHLISMSVFRDITGNRIEIVSRKDVGIHKNIESYGNTVLEALQSGQFDMENK